jgi:hypothetical protein
MLIWFAAGSVAVVWSIFQSPAVDYRMVMLGSVLAVAEAPFGPGPLDTLAVSCLALALVMVATVGHRLWRRRWLGIPIGMFLHLVLDGTWMRTAVFWWPAEGWRRFAGRSEIVSRGIWSVLLELIGVLLAVWLWGRFGLDDADRRHVFMRTGQLERSFVGGRQR